MLPKTGVCPLATFVRVLTAARHAAFQLRDRCHRLGLVLYDKVTANENVDAAIHSVTQCLQHIQTTMSGWAQTNKVQAFLHQAEVAKDIERCHNMLSDCLTSFQLVSHIEIHDWQAQFQLETQEDHRELVNYLTKIENSQSITNEALQSQGTDLRQLMSMMQHAKWSESANSQLAAQAQWIYEGLYLGREKVAIKVVRAVSSNESSLRRFKRECEIWKALWNIDRGKHVLPFYGFCQEDGPFPHPVAGKWYCPDAKGVALGLQVLHSMTPPVVHGDLKASNIVIDHIGNPLIADFGLSRIVEDITGIPFSQSRGVSDSYRWFAPEVCIGQGVLSMSSDVYAYGMTVLEIFTHEQPYNNIKHTTEVVIRSAKGEHPPRPTSEAVLRRGLNDDMWILLNNLWNPEPSQRPTIEQVLAMFPQ
ncbi:kinase-like domain-containing protein [Mycena alexandri]|uniref:Kinase-like domain-containing protein n=1 Tax=Mycena alexandri TaxID=1745969 RepID=A0AAD6TL27_9AGAR|nr:kinase-like domain-containing protein [Mycena alexandri]